MQEPKVEREEWREGDEIHYKEYIVVEKPNGKVFLTPDLDYRGTIVEKAIEIFDGTIVRVVDNRSGEVIFSRL